MALGIGGSGSFRHQSDDDAEATMTISDKTAGDDPRYETWMELAEKCRAANEALGREKARLEGVIRTHEDTIVSLNDRLKAAEGRAKTLDDVLYRESTRKRDDLTRLEKQNAALQEENTRLATERQNIALKLKDQEESDARLIGKRELEWQQRYENLLSAMRSVIHKASPPGSAFAIRSVQGADSYTPDRAPDTPTTDVHAYLPTPYAYHAYCQVLMSNMLPCGRAPDDPIHQVRPLDADQPRKP